jgi:hypothetical protein
MPQAGPAKVMHEMAKKLEELGVFSASPSRMSDEELERELKQLKKKVDEIGTEQLPSGRTYRITLKAIQQHVSETERVFRVGNRDYAKWMLKATTSLCVTCHTQTTQAKKLESFWTYKPVAPSGRNAYFDGEFLFVTRRFTESIPYYDTAIAGYPSNKLTPVEIDQAIRRKLAYFGRYSRDFKAAVQSLESDYKNTKLPEAIRNNLQAWIGLFRGLSKNKVPSFEKMSTSEIIKWANDQFKTTLWDKMIPAEDPRAVTHLYVSGVLYETLFSRPSDDNTADILLLLAKSENILNQQFFYSFGDLYLRDCILSFPKSNAAKQCYKELSTNLNEAYHSTTGLNLPAEINAELKSFRQMIGLDEQ